MPKLRLLRVETIAMVRMKLLVPILLSFGLAACNGNSRDDDDTSLPKDTGVADTGNPDTGTPDTGTPDTGTPDTGVGPCNVFDGTGCAGDQFCLFAITFNEIQCRDLPPMGMRAQHEEACNEVNTNCEPGQTCVNLGNGPQCHFVCDPADQNACSTVTGMAQDYFCNQRVDGNGAPLAVGLCEGGNLCNPAMKAMACPAGETCTAVGPTNTTCQMAGTAMLGQPCGGGGQNCVEGGICLDFGGGAQCYEGCDMQFPCTSMTARCQGVQGVSWGFCEEMGMGCDPLTMPCPGGQTCSLLQGSSECTMSGPGTPGMTCGATQCVDDAVCVFLMGNPDPLCYEPCDPMNAMCTVGMCQGLNGVDFGICI